MNHWKPLLLFAWLLIAGFLGFAWVSTIWTQTHLSSRLPSAHYAAVISAEHGSLCVSSILDARTAGFRVNAWRSPKGIAYPKDPRSPRFGTFMVTRDPSLFSTFRISIPFWFLLALHTILFSLLYFLAKSHYLKKSSALPSLPLLTSRS